MNKMNVLLLLSLFVLFATMDAKPQMYGGGYGQTTTMTRTNGYGVQQTRTTVQQTPYGTVQQTTTTRQTGPGMMGYGKK